MIIAFFSVKNNPTTLAVDGKTKLQLALNPAQLARTFEDRTHVFYLKPRILLPDRFKNSKIVSIGGMGKRGNIVQAYPAMEYRFTPERVTVTTKDVLCFAWSGESAQSTCTHTAIKCKNSTPLPVFVALVILQEFEAYCARIRNFSCKSNKMQDTMRALIGSKPFTITLWKHRKLLRAFIS